MNNLQLFENNLGVGKNDKQTKYWLMQSAVLAYLSKMNRMISFIIEVHALVKIWIGTS
jgi:hypothetical protein